MASVRVIRVARVVRVMRVLRMVRIMRFMKALRVLMYAILYSLRSAFWALMLVVIIFYGFGIIFTLGVTDCLMNASEDSSIPSDKLTLFWGSLVTSMFTLFKCTSGGVNWHEAVVPLSFVGWPYVSLFTLFIAFFVFAILNVMTAVFCQSAIESAQVDKELATEMLLSNQKQIGRQLYEFFKIIDQDESGSITMDELETVLVQRKSQAYLQSLGINTGDAWTLVKLLDVDNTGNIDLEEFITGCMDLRGEAKAVHVATLAYDQKMAMQMIEDFMESVEQKLALLLPVPAKS